MRVFTANVGVNRSHGFYSPLFEDDTFEFIPIPGGRRKYRESLRPYIPERLREETYHNSPDFVDMTYCDIPSSRGKNLEQADIDDVILFIAHLQRWERTDHGFYLIGGLRVDMFHRYQPLAGEYQERFRNNAGYDYAEENMLFAGDREHSRLFHRAVPLNREICDKVFRDARGKRFDWSKQGGNETRNIGSYTRTCPAS